MNFDLGIYNNFWNIYVLFIGGILALFISLISENKVLNLSIGGIFIVLSMFLTLTQNDFNFGFLLSTAFIRLSFVAILIPGILLLTGVNFSGKQIKWGLFNSILLISLGFMGLAIYSFDLLFIFVAFEGVSVTTYVLAGFGKSDSEIEAAVKYFLVGAFSTAIIVFGISFYYMSTGTLALDAKPILNNLYDLSLILLVFGFGFKLAIFPLHGWAIDTYTGTSNAVAALLSASSKIMTLIIAMDIFYYSPWFYSYLIIIFAIISVLTMTFGNLVAIWEKNVKRMLAYSSVAQAGYLSTVFLTFGYSEKTLLLAFTSIFLYAIAYVLMKGGAFLGLNGLKDYNLDSFSGIWKSSPAFAFSFSVLLLSLAGFPGTAGFIGKYFLFLSVISTGSLISYIVISIAVINSVLSFYYYGRVIMYMFWKQGRNEVYGYNTALHISAILTIAIGVLYFFIFNYAYHSIEVSFNSIHFLLRG
jgi:NADH:ubiquinone oxidoreductase subunit 2 (chain N)